MRVKILKIEENKNPFSGETTSARLYFKKLNNNKTYYISKINLGEAYDGQYEYMLCRLLNEDNLFGDVNFLDQYCIRLNKREVSKFKNNFDMHHVLKLMGFQNHITEKVRNF